MNKRNYQRELEEVLKDLPENPPKKLLLHSCCAPCSSYVLEYLSRYFEIILFYYNPNISKREEYEKRVAELKSLISRVQYHYPVSLVEGTYEPERFYEAAKGLEQEPERGKRCYECYKLRLEESAKLCRELGTDYFTTTLSISPMKNADWLNEIGEELAKDYQVTYLPSDFKKKGGYQRSIALSKEYDLYRQDYCGCIFSMRDRKQ
jgi:hypothetical protein